jgi:leishmanolysin-like peptidase
MRPDTNTLVFRTARGKVRAKIVTPKVLEIAREMFACATLDGVELENDDPGCFGSHWEERLFGPLVQTAITAQYGSVFSPLTLAFFEDSGWYRANFSSGLTRDTDWGYHAGCSFVNDEPIGCTDATSSSSSFDPFCNVAGTIASRCSADKTHKSQCINGGSAFDGCTFWSASEFGTCGASGGGNAATMAILGEVYGSNSRCVISTLRQKYTVGSSTAALPGDTPPGASCFQTACIERNITNSTVVGAKETKLAFKVVRHYKEQSYDQWLVCEREGQTHTLEGFKGELTCPNAADICGVAAGPLKPYLKGLNLGLESGQVLSLPISEAAPASQTVPCGDDCGYSSDTASNDPAEDLMQKIIDNWFILAAIGGGLLLICILCCLCGGTSRSKAVGNKKGIEMTSKRAQSNPVHST